MLSGMTVDFVELNGHELDSAFIRRELLAWGRMHFRPFAWRASRDPYQVLVAELMLHRTQASQAASVYKDFVRRYPDIRTLADAPDDEVHSALAPLGLFWRTALITKMARMVVEAYGATVPTLKSELLRLPGVGDYAASAVRCFAGGHPEAVVDTNTLRIIARLFGIAPRDSLRRKKSFRQVAESMVDPTDPRAYNYALLDLAHSVCTKRRPPDCYRCPLRKTCCTARY